MKKRMKRLEKKFDQVLKALKAAAALEESWCVVVHDLGDGGVDKIMGPFNDEESAAEWCSQQQGATTIFKMTPAEKGSEDPVQNALDRDAVSIKEELEQQRLIAKREAKLAKKEAAASRY